MWALIKGNLAQVEERVSKKAEPELPLLGRAATVAGDALSLALSAPQPSYCNVM